MRRWRLVAIGCAVCAVAPGAAAGQTAPPPRGTQIGAGWDPRWHQPTDVYTTFSDQDFRLGLNAAQTTLGAIGRLAGASLAG